MLQEKEVLDNILAKLDIESLNEMQVAFNEAAKEHQGIILISRTGTGKTLAFLWPVFQQLDPGLRKTQALVIVPSRELALQIEQVFRSMATGLKVTCCYGGHLRETEENNLVEPPALIIGTAGRLADHIRRGNITVDTIETLILDEYDKSLELGFQEEMSFIIGSLPHIKRRYLTSATSAEEIPTFIGLENPVVLNFFTSEGDDGTRLAIRKVISQDKDKLETLFRLVCHLGARPTIIFCNHRESVERTSAFLTEKGINNQFYHGAMEQQERDSALCKFRNGTTQVLVTTDLASRGLDIAHIRYIVHYHLPLTEDSFTHRNGRTARVDASGTAILILSPDEKLPTYVDKETESIELPDQAVIPEKPKWITLFVAAGKKDKINKVDIVGFLSQKGQLKKEDIGLIEVKDFFSFVAIRKTKATSAIESIKDQKIKQKKVKIEIAR
jgi:superfamily II DNA/RNA helicase